MATMKFFNEHGSANQYSDHLLLIGSDEFVGLSNGIDNDYIVVTLSSRRVCLYNVADRKLVNDWPVSSLHQITSPAIQLTDMKHFSAIVDNQMVCTWTVEDKTIDHKTCHTQLANLATKLFSLRNERVLVLYNDMSIGLLDDFSKFWKADINSSHGTFMMEWCDAHYCNDQTTLVVVLLTEMKQRLLVIYNISEIGQEIDVKNYCCLFGNVEDDLSHPSYCLQAHQKDIHLLTKYCNGQFSRCIIAPSFGKAEDIPYIPSINCSELISMVSIDETQLFLSGINSSNEVRVWIWDIQFGLNRGCFRFDLAHGKPLQLHRAHNRILLVTSTGIYELPFDHRKGSLRSSIGKKSNSARQVPDFDSFASVLTWVRTNVSSSDDHLSLQPSIDALVIKTICNNSEWSAVELGQLVDAHLLSSKVCPHLFPVIAKNNQFDLLAACLTNIPEITEPAIVIALGSILSTPEESFSSLISKQQLLTLLLGLPFNNSSMVNCLAKLDFAQVLSLLSCLEELLSMNSLDVTQPQMIDWLMAVADSNCDRIIISDEMELVKNLHNYISKRCSEAKLSATAIRSLIDDAAAKKRMQRRHNRQRYYVERFIY